MMKSRNYIIGVLLLSFSLLAACSNDSSNEEEENTANAETTENNVHKVDENNEDNNGNNNEEPEEESALDVLNKLAANSSDTDEIYVTDDIVIGEDEEVKPGIYDLEVTGGSGNIMGERDSVQSLFINWVGGAEGNDAGHPSKIRMILLEGDSLEFSDISKVKFHAVSEEVEPSNELGIGEFIVGRGIEPGDYELSTNVELDPEFDNLGWEISIYNDETGKTKDQTFTASNDDVVVSLEEGEIISTSYDNTDYGSSSDDAKLEFKEK